TISYNSNQPTASVSFSYDPVYSRVASMTDGVGTTTYSYYPVTSGQNLGANLLQSTNSPIAGATGSDTVTYSYDALNREVAMNIDGTSQSIAYDALGRMTTSGNALDTFSYTYADATARVTGISSTQGPNVSNSYYGPTGDEQLQQIVATAHSGGTLNQFGYAYNADDNITSFSVSSPASTTTYTYNKANRLLSASGSNQYAYGYDAASNILTVTTNGTQNSLSYTS